MKPILFTVGSFNVYSFGIFLALAFILSTFVLWKYAKEELKEDEFMDLYLYSSIFGLVVSRIIYIVQNPQDFGLNILRWILVRETPGLSLSGGLIAGVLFLIWYTKKFKLATRYVLDIYSIVISLGLIFIKIGESISGAAFGRETALFTGVNVIGKIGKFHPVELYEAFSYFIIFMILTIIYKIVRKNKWPSGLVFYLFVFFSSISIFALEFFKPNFVYLYKLDIRQYVSLFGSVFILIPLVRYVLFIKSLRKDTKS